MDFVVLIFLSLIGSSESDKTIYDHIYNLKLKIFTENNYNTFLRPTKDFKFTTKVGLILSPIRIISVDIQHETFTMDASLEMYWRDGLLTWDPDDYGNVEKIEIQSYRIWKPAINLDNSAHDDDLRARLDNDVAVVRNNGEIKLVVTLRLNVHCMMNLAYFPFDKQKCSIILRDRIYDIKEVNYYLNAENPHFPNDDFEVIDRKSNKLQITYRNKTQQILSVSYIMRRHIIGYWYFVILPYLTTVLLGLALFIMPVGSYYRLVLGSIAFFILNELLVYLGFMLGFNSITTPYAVQCVAINTLLIGLSLTLTTLVYNVLIHCMTDSPPLPQIISNFLNSPFINCVFFLDRKTSGKSVSFTSAEEGERRIIFDENDEQSNSPTENRLSQMREWIQLIQFIDRILFATYIFTMIYFHS